MTSLTRMGLHNQTTVENRFLAVDLASTLYWWDSKAASEMQAQADDSTPRRQFAKSGQESNFGLEPSMEQNIMNFLLRMALVRYDIEIIQII